MKAPGAPGFSTCPKSDSAKRRLSPGILSVAAAPSLARASLYRVARAVFRRTHCARVRRNRIAPCIERFSRSTADASYARKIRVFCIFRLVSAACFDLESNTIKAQWHLHQITRGIPFRPQARIDSTARFDAIQCPCSGKLRGGSVGVNSDGEWNRTKFAI
jgi:hypothetical protein